MMFRKRLALSFFSALLAASHFVHAQVAPAAYLDTMSNQITLSGIRTEDDYQLQTSTGLDQVRLTGAGIEYRDRRYYPFELIGSARYSEGQPLNQRLVTAAAGIGYIRSFPYHREHFYERVSPFAGLQLGFTRTSSNQLMYLYSKPSVGLTILTSAGIDYHTRGLLVFRPVFVENQYSPFGVHGLGSVYWNYGAGIGISFHHNLPRQSGHPDIIR